MKAFGAIARLLGYQWPVEFDERIALAERQRETQDVANGVDGAQERLAASESLKKKLELILEGESPHDIFVR